MKDIFIFERESIKDALKKLDKTAEKVLLVADEEKRLLGTITDGDIRRYVLSGRGLDNGIGELYNKKPIYIKNNDLSISLIREILMKNKINLLPVLDNEGRVIDFKTWDQVFCEDKIELFQPKGIDIPVAIMAGGEGTRLEPFTAILPKPLIPIGNKSIIEIIINEFRKWGISEYYLTLNHKGEMIKAYFNSIEKDYKLNYIWEDKGFLGTAGSLKFLEDKINDNLIVSNCDVIVRANFEDVLDFHKDKKASLTILSSIQHYKIPYGVIEFESGGEVTKIQEKPEYTFPINAGVYVLNKASLRHIPEGISFNMTDLIRSLIEKNKKVVMYPVNENDYVDIGQWEEYKKAIEKLQFFK